jgi:arylsulfatase A-like enzyme
VLTGLYPHQAGVGHMVSDRGYPAYQGYLNNRCATIAEALAPAGYRTLMSGKWHVGEKRLPGRLKPRLPNGTRPDQRRKQLFPV